MTETTNPNETGDRAELLRHAHRSTYAALQAYAAGLQGLAPDDVARLLIGSATTVVAATLGPEYTAALLYSIADQLAMPAGVSVN